MEFGICLVYILICLYASKNFLEAQLCALSAIMLLVRNSQEITKQDLNDAKKIFDKVTAQCPLTCHGLSLSIGSPDELDWEFLKKLKVFLKYVKN